MHFYSIFSAFVAVIRFVLFSVFCRFLFSVPRDPLPLALSVFLMGICLFQPAQKFFRFAVGAKTGLLSLDLLEIDGKFFLCI